jgi:hypothetical protein
MQIIALSFAALQKNKRQRTDKWQAVGEATPPEYNRK